MIFVGFFRWPAALFGLLALMMPARLLAQAIDIDVAKKEGRVVVYAAVPPQTMKAINDPFEKKYGIKVDYGALRRPEF